MATGPYIHSAIKPAPNDHANQFSVVNFIVQIATCQLVVGRIKKGLILKSTGVTD